MWHMVWGWAKRRHPDKPAKWVKQRYFRNDGRWTSFEGNAQRLRRSNTPITRYVKVRGTSRPAGPEQRDYWRDRRRRNTARQVYKKDRLALLRIQNGQCGLCLVPMGTRDMDDHHIVPREAGGSNTLENRMLVHRWCHHAHHQRSGYRAQKA